VDGFADALVRAAAADVARHRGIDVVVRFCANRAAAAMICPDWQ
jgi:hypothetical protein